MAAIDLRNFLSGVINFFVGLAIIILGLRILLRLFDANPGAGFVDWIYSTSNTLMEPFRGIFSPAVLERGIVLDVSALFAILMYALIGFLLMALVGLIPGADRTVVKRR